MNQIGPKCTYHEGWWPGQHQAVVAGCLYAFGTVLGI